MSAQRRFFGALATAIVLLILGRWGSGLYTDFLWFSSLHATEVWRARLATTTVVESGSFLLSSAFAFGNFYAVRRSIVSVVLPRRIANIEIAEELSGRYLVYSILALSVTVGIAMLLPADLWSEALLAKIGRPFGEVDPYLGADLGFFVYWLPFEMTLLAWSMTLFGLVTGVVILLYALTPSIRWTAGRLYVSAYAKRHLIVLGAVLLLLISWSYRIDTFRLLSSGSGVNSEFSILDQLVGLPVKLVLSMISLCAAVVVAWSGWTGQARLSMIAGGAVIILSLFGRVLAPPLVRRMMDRSDAAAQDRAHFGTRLAYTRRAFGVDRIRPETLGTGFASARFAAPRVALWDGATLVEASQRFHHVQVVGSGPSWQKSETGLSASLVEHGGEGSGGSHDVWDVWRVDPTTSDDRGRPVRSTGDGADDIVFMEPAVYDSAPAYSVLSDSSHRIAGVEIVSLLSRISHAWSLQNFRLLFGDLPSDRPTIVRHRDVRDRLHELAPFFVQGTDVIPVVVHNTLYWVIELYAVADAYPLAQRFTLLGEERGYVQHAATALVEAASGRVHLLADETSDAVTATWKMRFPALFVSRSALPSKVLEALPPALDGARAQALAFAVAGFRGDGGEARHFAVPDGADATAPHEPVRVNLPDFGVSALWPLLDMQERVRGVVAIAGGAAGGTSWIPLTTDGMRWGAVVDRLRTADTITRDASVTYGAVRVLPIGGVPFYLQSAFQSHPGGGRTLRHVTTLTADTLRSGLTFHASLGSMPEAKSPLNPFTIVRARIESLYGEMHGSLARGDWASFGRAFDSMGAVLRLRGP